MCTFNIGVLHGLEHRFAGTNRGVVDDRYLELLPPVTASTMRELFGATVDGVSDFRKTRRQASVDGRQVLRCGGDRCQASQRAGGTNAPGQEIATLHDAPPCPVRNIAFETVAERGCAPQSLTLYPSLRKGICCDYFDVRPLGAGV